MKNRKCLPMILMIWPYLSAGLIFVLITIESQFPALIMVLLALLTLVIYVANIVNACMYKIEDAGQPAFWNMLIKLAHIPFYLVMFVIGFGIFATSWLPGLIFFTPFIVMIFVVVDYCLMLTSSLYGINALIRARKAGIISTKYMVIQMVLHFVFFFDAISAINVWMKLKKYGN